MVSAAVPKRKKKHRHLIVPNTPKETISIQFREIIFPKQIGPKPESNFSILKADQSLDNNIRKIPKPKDKKWSLDLSQDERCPASIKHMYIAEEDLETPENRWVYIFVNKANTASLLFEIQPTDDDGAKCVDWGPQKGVGGHVRWRKEKFRPLSCNVQKVLIEKGKKYFAFISHYQLPFERIKELEDNHEYISKRAASFETQDGDFASLIKNQNGNNYLEVYLVDHLRISLYLQVIYILSHAKYLEYSGDPKRATRANIAQSAWRIAKSLDSQGKNAWDWIKRSELENELKTVKKIQDEYIQGRGNACLRRNKWYMTDSLKQALNDLEFQEDLVVERQKIRAKLLECSFESEEGQKYLDYAFEQDDSLMQWAKNPFGVGRKGAQLIQKLEFHDQAFKHNIEILKQMAFQKIKKLELEEAEREIYLIIKDKFSMAESVHWKDASGKTGKIDLKKEGVGSLGEYYDTKKMLIADEADFKAESMKLNRTTVANFMLVLDLINLMFAAKAFGTAEEKRKGKWNEWDEKRAFLGLIKASADVIKAIDRTTVSGIVAKKIGDEAVRKFIRVASIVAAICDYIGGLMDISKGIQKGRGELILSGTFTALAGVAGAASTAASITGTSILGLTAFTWTIIGVILLLAAIIIIWLFYEEEIEEWLRNTPWGKDKVIDWNRKRPDLSQLHANLYKIICRFFLVKNAAIGLPAFAKNQEDLVYFGETSRLAGPSDMSINFGYLPPTAIVEVEFEGSIKENEHMNVYAQHANVQIMPYMNSYNIISGSNLHFDDYKGPFFIYTVSTHDGDKCRSLFMNLVDDYIFTRHREIWNKKSPRTGVLKIVDEMKDLISWTYSVRIDLFGDGSMKIPFNGPLVINKQDSAFYQADSYKIDT